MLYLFNTRDLEAEAQTFDFGTIYQVALGEKGRGRKLLSLTCPEGTKIKRGQTYDLTIGQTKSGKPKIVKKETDELYMLLSSEGGYTRRGDGIVYVLKGANVEVLTRGNGADGMAGRIGTWDAVLVKVTGDAVFRIRTSGGGYGVPSTIVVVKNNNVVGSFPITEADKYYDNVDEAIPWNEDDEGHLITSEWTAL